VIKKSGKFLADWRDEQGRRRRKAFISRESAARFSRAQQREAAAKKARASKRSASFATRDVKTAAEIKTRLDELDAERLILTEQFRNDLIRAATELLPSAIAQAKPTPARGSGRDRKAAKPGSTALLRLISRLAMRPAQIGPCK
jgi:hypothetical protein